jgi:TrpR-related protein YerC/YecD
VLEYAKVILAIRRRIGMAEKWKDRLTDQLCKGILSLETVEDVYCFLEDIATIGEIRALAQRLEVARLLSEGYTYPQIAQQTGASTATISRVKKFLEYGADGYKLVLENIKEKE